MISKQQAMLFALFYRESRLDFLGRRLIANRVGPMLESKKRLQMVQHYRSSFRRIGGDYTTERS